MEAENTKKQEETQQIKGLEQKGESRDAQIAPKGEGEAGKTEAARNEAHGEGEAGKTEADRNEAHGEGEAGKTEADGNEAHGEGEAGKTEAARNEAHGEGEAGKTEAAGNEAHGEGEAGKTEAAGNEAHGEGEAGKTEAARNEAHGEGEAGKTEAARNEAHGEGEAGKTEAAGNEAHGEGKTEAAGNEAHGEGEPGKTEAAGNEAHGEGEAGKTGAAGNEAKEDTEEALGSKEVQGSETVEKVKVVGEGDQAEPKDRVAVGVSGTELKEEGVVSETPEELQRRGRGKADGLEENTSTSSREGQTDSTSNEPLSLEPEEEEEFWPEFSPSSPDESPQSPTSVKTSETGGTISSPTVPEAAPGDTASIEAGPKGNREQQPAPEEAAATKEKKKRPTFDRREITRPRVPPRAQSRKAIMEKFGGAATGPAPNIKRTGGANTVKTMLLEWCRAKTRGYEHVDIQNFSTSWSSGMAFCALIHKFFPDAFDYAALDPANRRENFDLAFSTAEKHADCAQLLEVDDMVRMKVPDNKCIYTYIQELYRSLVEKGLVKTKQK
ncbi:smoothelin-like protein 1 [Elgaria multicarinata webbii]|uniref:smoothelin-like protein 1 n=1 Tax=Elgaria multicarinata webbii TaxID=159646 RepID=UPI002FCD59B8